MEIKRIVREFDLKAVSEGDNVTVEGWANKAVVDDVGDLMKFDKVDLTRFKKNPILFYNHDKDLPLGKIKEVKVTPEGLWVKAILTKSEKLPLVSYIRDLVKEGILKTFSIGFEPKQENFNRADGYNEITEWRLNELSIVTLPANIDAEFALAKSLNSAKDYSEAKSLVLKALRCGDCKSDEPKVEDTTQDNPPKEGESENEDEEKKKTAFQECVSRKIPKLINEGKPEEQAVAIAMSMCREEGKCDVSIMSPEMFDLAFETAKGCKKPKKEEEERAEGSEGTKEVPPPPPAVPVSQPSDDPSNFGSPHMDMLKSMLALMGKISEQLGAIQALLEKEEEVGETDSGNPELPPENGEASAKGLAKIAEIRGRIEALVKDL